MVSALGIASHVHNTQKMEHWRQVVAGAPDGARVLVMDADTVIMRPLDDVWEQDFDIAYTTKPQEKFPFNSGVIFLRVSDRTRAFVDEWRAENRRMLGDAKHHQVWRKQYGGINQAALGYMLSKGERAGVRLLKLPCREWNCEDSSWARFDPATTRIVHVKSGLRRAIFFGVPSPSPGVTALVKTWRALERAALDAERPAPDIVVPAPADVQFVDRPPAPAPAPLKFRRRGRPHGPETVVHSVRIKPATYDACCRLALQRRAPVGAVIQSAIDAYVKRQEHGQ